MSVKPWENTESFRHPGPAKSQPHSVRGNRSIRDGKAASLVPHAAQHDHMSFLGRSPTRHSHQLMPDQNWETMSDQESAIDCDGPNQIPTSDQEINSWDWMQGQSNDENSRFNAWLESLVTSQYEKNFSQTSTPPKSFKEPILVYETKKTRFEEPEQGPLLAIKKSPHSDKTHHAHKSARSQSEVEKVDEPETTKIRRIPSYKAPSLVDIAEEPALYDPGLQIFWRDV